MLAVVLVVMCVPPPDLADTHWHLSYMDRANYAVTLAADGHVVCVHLRHGESWVYCGRWQSHGRRLVTDVRLYSTADDGYGGLIIEEYTWVPPAGWVLSGGMNLLVPHPETPHSRPMR